MTIQLKFLNSLTFDNPVEVLAKPIAVVVKMARPKRPDDGIEQFFSATEFQEMSDYEKLRLRNIKANYEMMVEIGKQHC